jgi:hypothetical protein
MLNSKDSNSLSVTWTLSLNFYPMIPMKKIKFSFSFNFDFTDFTDCMEFIDNESFLDSTFFGDWKGVNWRLKSSCFSFRSDSFSMIAMTSMSWSKSGRSYSFVCLIFMAQAITWPTIFWFTIMSMCDLSYIISEFISIILSLV